jgi:hypothetical protein
MGGRSFDVHAEVGSGQAQEGTLEDSSPAPERGWHGHYKLADPGEQAELDAALAQAVVGGHDVVLQLHSGEETRINIDGERFIGLDQWPLD